MANKKVATVIGAGPGLGAALARHFAADYAVALVARNAEKLIELAREISAAGGTCDAPFRHTDGYKAQQLREHLESQHLWRLSRRAAGGARDASEGSGSDPVHGSDCRC